MKELSKTGIIRARFFLVVSTVIFHSLLVREIMRQIDNFWVQMSLNIPIAYVVGGLAIYFLMIFPKPPHLNIKIKSKRDLFFTKLMMALGILSVYIVLGLRVRREIEDLWLLLFFLTVSGFIVGWLITYVSFKLSQGFQINSKNSLNMEGGEEKSKYPLDTKQ